MAVGQNIANKVADIGVKRDPNADINVNATDNSQVSDLGVKTLILNTTNPRDRDGGRPNHKTSSQMSGPTARNPKDDTTNYYQK